VAGIGGGALATALAILLSATGRPLLPPSGRVWVVMLDVGQGDAIAVAFHDGWWLVDAGPRSARYDAGEGAVLPFLRWAGVHRLETLVLTHDDGDHAGGAAAVLRGTEIGRVCAPPAFPKVAGPRARFAARAAACGDRLHAEPPVHVLWPPPAADSVDRAVRLPETDNAASLVLELGEKRGRVLMLADVDSTVEQSLRVEPGVALLKVAHHGSGSSSGESFLARARPRLAAISCGRRNPFGHPDARALERLAECGAEIRRTDREGALWFEIDPTGARSLDWRGGEPRPGTGLRERARVARPADQRAE
jgi:competence protein ComEC